MAFFNFYRVQSRAGEKTARNVLKFNVTGWYFYSDCGILL
jgi:hypothetical protein